MMARLQAVSSSKASICGLSCAHIWHQHQAAGSLSIHRHKVAEQPAGVLAHRCVASAPVGKVDHIDGDFEAVCGGTCFSEQCMFLWHAQPTRDRQASC